MPVTPSKLPVEIKGKNKTIDLLNEGEINFLKTPGLTKITLPLMLPMLTGDKRPDYYLGLFEKTMVNRETTRLKLIRSTPDGLPLFDTDLKVSIENYKIKEDAEEGLDMFVDVELLQYRDYGTKKVSLKKITETGQQVLSVQKERDSSTAPKATQYTVKRYDTLWDIAARELGDPNRWREIYELNKGKISDPNLIRENWELVLPKR